MPFQRPECRTEWASPSAPTRQDILNLGAMVLLGTLLNYFLEREIRQVEQRSATGSPESWIGEETT